MRRRSPRTCDDDGPRRAEPVGPFDTDQTRLDLGLGPEDVFADRPGARDVAVVARLDARHTVDTASGGRREAVGDLGLHHHQRGAQRRELGHEMQQHRNGDVVRQVRHQRGGRRRQVGRGHSERVGGHHVERSALFGREIGDGPRQPGGQLGVDLDRDDAPRLTEQCQSQRPESGPHFEDHVVGADTGRGDDATHRVRIVDEVLTQCLGGPDVQLRGERADLGGTEESRRHTAKNRRQPMPSCEVHDGQAPQPCAAWVFLAIAICSSRVARSARGAYSWPPQRSQVFWSNWMPP